LKGAEIGGKRLFTFSSGSPIILRSDPNDGGQIVEDQAFILSLNSEVDEKWLLEHSYFIVEGIQEKIPLKIISGKERERILRSSGCCSLPLDRSSVHDGKFAPTVAIVQAKRMFPPSAKVTLVWGDREEKRIGFRVRDDFSVKLTCPKENSESDCIPISSLNLQFSSPVLTTQAAKIRLIGKDGKMIKPRLKSDDADSAQTLVTLEFNGPFAERSEYQIEYPSNLKDESDRPLSHRTEIPLKVKTDVMPSLAKFSAEFGIVEASDGPVLPVTIRNIDEKSLIRGRMVRMEKTAQIESIIGWMSRVRHQLFDWEKRGSSILTLKDPSMGSVENLEIPKLQNSSDLEVVGIPIQNPGFYVVELESRILGKRLLGADKPMYVSTIALVTDLAVHFKRGRESSLAWVTSLATGKPVAQVKVSVRDCQGRVLSQGQTRSDGILEIGPLPEKLAECREQQDYSPYFSGVFVTAEKGSDFSFAHSSWNRGIESWRFNIPTGWENPPDLAHSVLDRSLFRTTETVHMKHFLRKHTVDGIKSVIPKEFPDRVRIQQGDEKYEFPLRWDDHGTAETDWTIPKVAKLGMYTITFFLSDPSQT